MGSQKVCRTCGKNENPTSLLTFLFGEEADQLDLRAKIKKYTPIQLSKDDRLPKSICCECKKTIINWHLFWEQCSKIDSDLKLKLLNFVEVKPTCFGVKNLSKLSQVEAKIDSFEEKKTNQCVPLKNFNNTKCSRKGFYCIAKWCNNNSSTKRMFRIPKDKRCFTWLSRAERDDLKDLDAKKLYNKYLCEDHFTDNMFRNSNRNSLIWNALPTIFSVRPGGNMSTKSSKGTSILEEHITKICRKRFRPIMIKDPELKNQPVLSRSTICHNSAVTLLGLPGLQITEKEKHGLGLNIDSKITHLNHEKNDKIDKVPKKVLMKSILVQNKEIDHPKNIEDNKKIDGDAAAYANKVYSSNCTVDINKTVENNENGIKDVCEEVLGITEVGYVKDLGKTVDGYCSQENSMFNNITIAREEPVCDFIRSEEEEFSFHTNSSYENIVKDDRQNNSSAVLKNLNSCSTAGVDSIDNFKESDVDCLCSNQCFVDSMYPCLACGEVFLMRSSLDQHCKTYHVEKFDDISDASSLSCKGPFK